MIDIGQKTMHKNDIKALKKKKKKTSLIKEIQESSGRSSDRKHKAAVESTEEAGKISKEHSLKLQIVELWNSLIERDLAVHSQKYHHRLKDFRIHKLEKSRHGHKKKIASLKNKVLELTEQLSIKECQLNDLNRDYEYIQTLIEDNNFGKTVNHESISEIQENIVGSITMINSLAGLLQGRPYR